jgi:hypothetical protein
MTIASEVVVQEDYQAPLMSISSITTTVVTQAWDGPGSTRPEPKLVSTKDTAVVS